MNWEAISAISEIFGAIAVVVSLVYLGRQFRHSSTDSLENIYFQTASNFSSSPENASVISRGNSDYLSLSDVEKQHYVMMLHNLFSAIEAIHIQSKRNLTNRESAERVLKVAHFYHSQPGFQMLWAELLRSYFDVSFVEAVESQQLIKDAPGTDVSLGHTNGGDK